MVPRAMYSVPLPAVTQRHRIDDSVCAMPIHHGSDRLPRSLSSLVVERSPRRWPERNPVLLRDSQSLLTHDPALPRGRASACERLEPYAMPIGL
jgi:hypothetical protein